MEPRSPLTSGGSTEGERGERGWWGRWRGPALLVGAALLVATLVTVVLVPRGGPRATGEQAAGTGFVAGPASNLLGLDVLARHNWYKASGFALTDQSGRRVSLGQFRGRSVVLTFNDDRCKDLCTLLAQDVVAADRDLGREAGRVVFLGVNVNPFYPEVRYVRTWSNEHGLGGLPNWFFTTGPVKQLEEVWHRYGVYVALDQKDRTVTHSTEIFFVNPAGHVVGIGDFGDNAANTSLFGHALAQMAVDLLPAGERAHVGGPSVPAPSTTNATVGARAPAFALPLLGSSRRRLSSSALRGRYLVLNFWSSTCTACKAEMPAIERAYRDLAGGHRAKKVAFVGVDVADRPASALALAKRAGVTYPLVSDRSGTLAGAYRAPGLPFTAIVGPGGTVLVRHPGTLTTEQLVYVMDDEVRSASGQKPLP